jgi:hypothetical protein
VNEKENYATVNNVLCQKRSHSKQRVSGQSDAQKEDQILGHRNKRLNTFLFNLLEPEFYI